MANRYLGPLFALENHKLELSGNQSSQIDDSLVWITASVKMVLVEHLGLTDYRVANYEGSSPGTTRFLPIVRMVKSRGVENPKALPYR